MTRPRSRIAAALVLFAASGISWTGCDGSTGTESTADPRPERADEPNFNWRESLRSPPSEAEAALGSPETCRPDRRLLALHPADQGFFEDDIRKCHYPQAESNSKGSYYVDSILYTRKIPTATILRSSEPMPLSPKLLERFYIPRLPVVRRRITDWGGRERRVLSFRTDVIRGDLDRGKVIAVDLAAQPDDPDQLDFVRIAAISKWPYSIDHVRLRGPDPVQQSLVVPRILSRGRLGPGMALVFGVDTFVVRPQKQFPLVLNGDDPEFEERTFDRGLLTGDASSEGETWREQSAEVVRRWIEHRRELGKVPTPVKYNVFATQTTEFEIIAAAAARLREVAKSRFRAAGRSVRSYGVPFSEFARIGLVPIRFGPGGDGEQRSGDGGPVPRLALTSRGFEPKGLGASTPAEKCPADGPSLCLTSEVEMKSTLERARRLQKKGELRAADEKVEEILAAYDWRALYNLISTFVADEATEPRTLYLEPGPEVPFAAVVRTARLARRRVGRTDGERCLERLPEETNYGSMTLCPEGGEVPATLFEEVRLVRPE